MATYQRTIQDTKNDKFNPNLLKRELILSGIENLEGFMLLGNDITLVSDGVLDENGFDEVLSNHEGGALPIPVIFDICKPSEKSKDAVDINYKTHISEELFSKTNIKKNGFVQDTVYYRNYDEQNKVYSNPVIKVEALYNVANDSSIESAKSISDKSKVWIVMLDNGEWATEKDEWLGWYKSKHRTYTHTEGTRKRDEGHKRRTNIQNILSEELVELFIGFGVVSGSSIAESISFGEDILISFLGNFDSAMNLWRTTGRGSDKPDEPNIYRDVEDSDSFPWLDINIPHLATPSFTNVVTLSSDMTIREYIIGRLKSEIV